MSISINKAIKLLALEKDYFQIPDLDSQDLIVGRDREISLTVPSNRTLTVRDVVVLGKLNLKGFGYESSIFKCRNLYIAGEFHYEKIGIDGGRLIQYRNYQVLRSELTDFLCDWWRFQRDTVNKIGLRSILC